MTRAADLRQLWTISDEGITPSGWLFAAIGWSVRSPGGPQHTSPRDHENRRRVYLSSYLDHQTGELTARMDFYPDEVEVIVEAMPSAGWQPEGRNMVVAALDLFRRAALAPAHGSQAGRRGCTPSPSERTVQ